MYNPELVAKATPWEIQCQIETVDMNIRETELLLNRLKYARNDLRIVLCLKENGQHDFVEGKCECGAVDYQHKDNRGNSENEKADQNIYMSDRIHF